MICVAPCFSLLFRIDAGLKRWIRLRCISLLQMCLSPQSFIPKKAPFVAFNFSKGLKEWHGLGKSCFHMKALGWLITKWQQTKQTTRASAAPTIKYIINRCTSPCVHCLKFNLKRPYRKQNVFSLRNGGLLIFFRIKSWEKSKIPVNECSTHRKHGKSYNIALEFISTVIKSEI